MASDEDRCKLGWSDYSKLKIHSKCKCDRDLRGTLSIVTGANAGIGYETVKVLADKGSTVIMACRSMERATKARNALLQENPNRIIHIEIVDLASLASIRSFAERIRSQCEKIDILVNNAGVFMDSTINADGYEIHFAVNYLGHFLLTNLILDKLRRSPDARIINISSSLHFVGNWDVAKMKKPIASTLQAYCNSKLYNIMFTKELHSRIQGSSITVYAVNPGLVETDISNNFKGSTFDKYVFLPIQTVAKLVALKSPEQGVQTIKHVALNNDIGKYSGKYFSECEKSAISPLAKSSKRRKELWKISEQYSGLS